jgi:hypothetical protein
MTSLRPGWYVIFLAGNPKSGEKCSWRTATRSAGIEAGLQNAYPKEESLLVVG